MTELADILFGAMVTLLVVYGRTWLLRLRAWWFGLDLWVDCERGNDAHPGTRRLPLRSLAELYRRTAGPLRGDLRVHLTGTFLEPLELACHTRTGSVVTVSGEPHGLIPRLRQRVCNLWCRFSPSRTLARWRATHRDNQTLTSIDVTVGKARLFFRNINFRL